MSSSTGFASGGAVSPTVVANKGAVEGHGWFDKGNMCGERKLSVAAVGYGVIIDEHETGVA